MFAVDPTVLPLVAKSLWIDGHSGSRKVFIDLPLPVGDALLG